MIKSLKFEKLDEVKLILNLSEFFNTQME